MYLPLVGATEHETGDEKMTNPFGGDVDVMDAAGTPGPVDGIDDGLGDEAPRFSERVSPRDLFGRTVLLVGTKIERVPNDRGQDVDRMTCDIHVIDGGTLAYGGKPWKADDPVPHDKSCEVPAVFPQLFVSNGPVVDEMRDVIGKNKPKAGVFELGKAPADRTKSRAILFKVLERGDPRRAAAAAYWKAYLAKADDGLA